MMGSVRRLLERLAGGATAATGPPALVALDIGTELAKVLVASVEPGPGGGLVGVVRGVGREAQGLAHMQSGTVTDIDAVVENCRRALDAAEAMAGRRPAVGVVGIAGELVKGATSVGSTRRPDPQRPLDEEEFGRIVAAAQATALAEAEERIGWESGLEQLDVRLVHAAVVEIKIDGYTVSNPIGFTGSQVELAVFNAFAPMVHLGALQSVAGRLGLDLLGVIAEPYAVATCLDAGEMGESGAIFIDIGGGTTDVALVRQGGIGGTKMLALGGRAFTRGVAERFSLSFARAEALKLAVSSGATLPEKVKRAALQHGLREDAEVWLAGVELMIGDLADGELLPARVLLCGGGAQLPQVGEALQAGDWWRRLPFSRQPSVAALAPTDVQGVTDATGLLTTRQDVTPMALVHQAIIIDAITSPSQRAMRRAVKSLNL